MTSVHPAVEWVLETIQNWYGYGTTGYGTAAYGEPPPLRLIDRDNSQVFDGSESIDMTEPIHERKKQLKAANYVGASFASRGGDLVGTEPMLDTDVVVNVRLEGLHHSEWGEVDPAGVEGIPWGDLVGAVRDALWSEVEYPTAGPDHVQFRYLTIDEDPQSEGWKDFYRHSMDVTLYGYEEINR